MTKTPSDQPLKQVNQRGAARLAAVQESQPLRVCRIQADEAARGVHGLLQRRRTPAQRIARVDRHVSDPEQALGWRFRRRQRYGSSLQCCCAASLQVSPQL